MNTVNISFPYFLDQTSSIIQVIEESLYSQFSALPRQIRGTDEDMKLRILHVILGYLRLLGDGMKTTFNADHLVKRMFQALTQVTLAYFTYGSLLIQRSQR